MHTYPQDFINQMQQLLGGEATLFFEALQRAVVTSVRLNPLKKNNLQVHTPVKWCSTGFYLQERPVFTLDPLFHAGAYYVQESSSMFLEVVIKQLQLHIRPVHALDLCGAPGGKTTHLLSVLHNQSLLVTNEVIQSRVKILEENVIKWGYANSIITHNEAKDFAALPAYFDLIVCDAPCSGEGMFRKDKDAAGHWSSEAVLFCSQRQRKIIADVLPSLKPGGIIIYSTCTFNHHENEDVVNWMVQEMGLESIPINTDNFPEVVYNNQMHTSRFYPHKLIGEGFTFAVLQKQVNPYSTLRYPKEKPKQVDVGNVFNNAKEFCYLEENNGITAYHKNHLPDAALLRSKLKVVHSGTPIFNLKGKDKVPTHALAMSTNFNAHYFNTTELNKQNALKYLKGETNFDINGNEGYYTVTHQQQPLGFLKKIKNRCNNLYPRHQFIRMQIV